MNNKSSKKTQNKAPRKITVICSTDFKIGETVIYDGYTCVVENKDGYTCLGMTMSMGRSYFIPNWADVKRL